MKREKSLITTQIKQKKEMYNKTNLIAKINTMKWNNFSKKKVSLMMASINWINERMSAQTNNISANFKRFGKTLVKH